MGSKKINSQVKILLTDTILALCKNTLNQYREVAVEGLIGITLDKDEIFLVSVHEVIKTGSSKRSEGSSRKHKHNDGSVVSDGESDSESASSRAKRKRRKKHKRSQSTESDGVSKGSKSDGETNSRKSPMDASSSQVVIKQEVDDEIVVTKENIRGKRDGHASGYNQAGGDYADQSIMNPSGFLMDPQMSQYQASPGMTSTMAQTGSPARYRSQLNVRFQNSGTPVRFVQQQNRGMVPQQFMQPRRVQFRPGPPPMLRGGPTYGQRMPLPHGFQRPVFQRPPLVRNETPQQPSQMSTPPMVTVSAENSVKCPDSQPNLIDEFMQNDTSNPLEEVVAREAEDDAQQQGVSLQQEGMPDRQLPDSSVDVVVVSDAEQEASAGVTEAPGGTPITTIAGDSVNVGDDANPDQSAQVMSDGSGPPLVDVDGVQATVAEERQNNAIGLPIDLSASSSTTANVKPIKQLSQAMKKPNSAWDDAVVSVLNIDTNTIYPCILCGDTLKSVTDLGVHLRQSHRDDCPPCCVCGNKMKRFSSFKRHLLEHVRKDRDKIVSVTSSGPAS